MVSHTLWSQHLHTLAVDVELTQPYKCGFLGFREVPFMVRLLDLARRDFPDLVPQVVLVDGNGVLHPKRKLRLADNIYT